MTEIKKIYICALQHWILLAIEITDFFHSKLEAWNKAEIKLHPEVVGANFVATSMGKDLAITLH